MNVAFGVRARHSGMKSVILDTDGAKATFVWPLMMLISKTPSINIHGKDSVSRFCEFEVFTMSPFAAQEAEKSLPDVALQETEKEEDGLVEYPSMQKRILIMVSLYLSIFLVTLV